MASPETQILHYGNIVVTEQALAIGVTAVPTPATDNGADWYVYESGGSRFQVSSAVGFDNRMAQYIQFDSKAMRKVEEGQQLITVLENDALSAGIDVITFVRTLIKLH